MRSVNYCGATEYGYFDDLAKREAAVVSHTNFDTKPKG